MPTCREQERAGDVHERLTNSPIDALVVVNEHDVVMGLLPPRAPHQHPDAPVGDLLLEGPTTVRPAEDREALHHRMEHAGAPAVLVTRPDGVLVGVELLP